MIDHAKPELEEIDELDHKLDPRNIDKDPAFVKVTEPPSSRIGESCWGPTTCIP